uniref:Integrin, alpha 3b n=1 Tax=Mastacembelus armatus TaxID=205130 RepID=A0A7N8YNT4_9TELE
MFRFWPGKNSLNMFPRLLLCAVLAVQHGTQTCSGFNIDTRFPVIKEGKTKGSFFGFSVDLHQQTKSSRKYLLLAGAPREKAQSLKDVNETGAVYSCPITKDRLDCSRMDLVTTTTPNERVEGMWLGVTVASQRDQPVGRVLACGHRYVKVVKSGTDKEWRMIGKCYVRSNDLTYDPNDDWQTYSYEVCNPNLEVEFEGMCNAGISGGITGNDVYIGATGSYLWQGNVHITWRNPDPGHDDYTVVTGSPRDESKGSVVLGKKSNKVIETVLTIRGEQVGSYFGSSLVVTDLNNDNWNDLIVGAPFYFDRMKDQGGAVYIFMNENGSFQMTATMVLNGPSGSAFGIAVAAIGDINQDGFQDFAVGAPFHNTGKVYIWMGSKKGISKAPSQEIDGKSVGNEFKTFGYSISGGMDMDDNSYPDVVVGSLDDPPLHYMLYVFALIKAVKYTVEADTERRRSPRVTFQNNNADTYTGLLSLKSSVSRCSTLKLLVVEPVRDKLEPVVFSLKMSLDEQKPNSGDSLQNLDFFPILSQEKKLSQKTEINFQKECGTDNKCTSNLQLTAQFVNDKDDPYPSSVKKIKLMVEVTNFPTEEKLAEDAHQATLNVTIPDALTYSSVRSTNPLVQTQFGGTVMGESAMANTSDVGSLVEFTFNVNMQGQPLGNLGTLAVEFQWPYEVTNGKWLLYLTKIVVKGESETECKPGDVVNPLKLRVTTNRGPRSVLQCDRYSLASTTFDPFVKMFSCCVCLFLQDYTNALRVTVKGQASLKLITDKPTIRMGLKETRFTVEIEPVLRVETPSELPLWIIISAVVAGILLLGIIIIILWKCGFFQRASRREMYEAKAQKAEMKSQPSETKRMIEDY